MSKRISIDALIPGMVIVQVTRQNGPVKIRKSGLVTSAAMVQGLAEMGVQEVEIDPEQTVELEPQIQHRTQTQQLLRGAHDKTAGLDSQLSEQFNRSLFLPTVQGLPSAGKMFIRSVSAYLVMILTGAGIGFAAGTAGTWWPSLWSSTEVAVTQIASPSSDKQDPVAGDTQSTSSSEQSASGADDNQAAQSPPSAAPQTNTQPSSQTSPPSAEATGSAQPDIAASASDDAVAEKTESAQAASDYEGKVLNAPPQAEQGQVPQLSLIHI